MWGLSTPLMDLSTSARLKASRPRCVTSPTARPPDVRHRSRDPDGRHAPRAVPPGTARPAPRPLPPAHARPPRPAATAATESALDRLCGLAHFSQVQPCHHSAPTAHRNLIPTRRLRGCETASTEILRTRRRAAAGTVAEVIGPLTATDGIGDCNRVDPTPTSERNYVMTS